MAEMMWITQMVYVLQEGWMVEMAWRPQVTLKSYTLRLIAQVIYMALMA